MNTRELVSSAQRANFDFAFGLAGALLDEVGKLAELNARFTRSALKDAWVAAESAIDKPQDWTAVRARSPSRWPKLQSYHREWLDIVSSGHADVIKVAQAGSDQYVHRIQAFVDDAAKFAPSGSEATVAAWNSAIVAANTLYQTLGSTGSKPSTSRAATSTSPRSPRRSRPNGRSTRNSRPPSDNGRCGRRNRLPQAERIDGARHPPPSAWQRDEIGRRPQRALLGLRRVVERARGRCDTRPAHCRRAARPARPARRATRHAHGRAARGNAGCRCGHGPSLHTPPVRHDATRSVRFSSRCRWHR